MKTPSPLCSVVRLLRLTAIISVFFLIFVSTPLVGNAAAATSKKASSSAKKSAAKKTTSAKKAPAKRSTVTKRKTTTARARTSRRRSRTRSARFRGQTQPTSDRYREIQQALNSAGFLEAEPSGKWDEPTVSAMKRFQEQHAISPSGKIDALSLIALGLGPKRGPAPGGDSVLESPPTTDSSPSDVKSDAKERE